MNKKKVLSFYREYDAEIISLLHGVVDFDTRKRWNVNIKDIDNVTDDVLTRLGTSHRCILEKGQSIFYSSSYSFAPEKIEYSETDDNKTMAAYYTFTKITDEKTGLTVDLYLKKNPLTLALFNLLERKKLEKTYRQSLQNLVEFMKEVKLPTGN